MFQDEALRRLKTPQIVAPRAVRCPPCVLAFGFALHCRPNHACATAAQHDRYHVVRGGAEILKTLPRINGWC
jgi:D-serine deaminase-like pyridoxal phosphate-dependent protein